jgi:NitT/TauT family transport system substrate-binding protein
MGQGSDAGLLIPRRDQMITRRQTLGGLSAVAALAAGAAPVRAQAPRTVKVCTFRVLHGIAPHFYERFAPANLKFEVVSFDSPTDAKNAVVTKSVDFGGMGIAAATLGAASREPIVVIGAFANKGMAVIAKAGSDIKTVKDLRGKKVGIWPGSTQEVFIMERMRMEGMSIRDLTPVRIPFGEMHTMLARGEIEAFVGSELAPSTSVVTGVGQLVEYPYATAMGPLNMVMTTSEDMVAKEPDLVRQVLGVHRKASEFMMANKPAVVDMAVARLGANRAAAEHALAMNNVEYAWALSDDVQRQARTYAAQMLELRQIRALPEFEKFLLPAFSQAVSG